MRLKRFENAAQLREAVESRLDRQLSGTEWQAIAPNWSPPYDTSDVVELVQGAAGLPTIGDERVRNLAADVERLQTQIPGYDPRRPEGSALLVGLEGIAQLYRYIAAEQPVAGAPDPSADQLAALYWAIGRLLHEGLASDWLAERYGLTAGAAHSLMMGWTAAHQAAEGTGASSRSYATTILTTLPAVGPRLLEKYREGRRQGAVKGRGELTATDLVLLDAHRARSAPGATGWAQTWAFYEAVRLRCLQDPEVFSEELRSFSGWRAFRVAVKRAERRAARSDVA